MSETTKGRVDIASHVIHASPHTLFAAWLDPHSLMSWLPPHEMDGRLELFDPREGGPFRMTLTYKSKDHTAPGKSSAHADVVNGRFTRLIPDELIEQAIDFESEESAFAGTMTMTWTFEPVAEGTLVTIRCDNVPVGIKADDHQVGLQASLRNLAAYTEALR